MANITLQINQVLEFVSQEVVSQESAAVDVERFKREVELYLAELLRAVKADLDAICENCCPSSP